MTKSSDAWNVRPHGDIERLAENLWRVEGTLPGMSLKRVMTVAKNGQGELVLHSAIAMNETQMSELENFGKPRFLLIPSAVHRLDAPAYKRRYPTLKVLVPRGSRKKVEELLPVDGVYEDFPNDDSLTLHTLPGVAEREGAMILRSQDGISVVLNDVVFNMDRKRDVLGFLFTTLLGSAPGPRVSRMAKLALVKDARALRAELERLAALPNLVRLIVAHEKVASGKDAASALLQAAGYL